MSAFQSSMMMGMRSQLGMGCLQSTLSGGHSINPARSHQRYPGPGPIQRPAHGYSSSLNSSAGVQSQSLRNSSNSSPMGGSSSAVVSGAASSRHSNTSSGPQAKHHSEALNTTQAFFTREGNFYI